MGLQPVAAASYQPVTVLNGSRGTPTMCSHCRVSSVSRAVRSHILYMSPERVFTWEWTDEACHLNQRGGFLLRDAVKLGVAVRLSRSSEDKGFSAISCSFLSSFLAAWLLTPHFPDQGLKPALCSGNLES